MQTIKNPVKAIRAYCLGCCGGNMAEVTRCPAETCELHPFRFGKNPYRKTTPREYTAEQRQAMAERMKKINQGKREGK